MPAGFPTDANFLPRLTFDARSGQLFKVDREPDDSGKYATVKTEIPLQEFVALADVDSVRKGWVHISIGAAPEDKLVSWVQQVPSRPPGKNAQEQPLWQPTITFRVKLAPALGGQIRQFQTTSVNVINSLDHLIDGWLQDPAGAELDKCPAIKITGKTAIHGRSGTNYAPQWATVGWRTRPDDMAIGAPADEWGEGDSAGSEPDPWEVAPANGTPAQDNGGGTDSDDLPFGPSYV